MKSSSLAGVPEIHTQHFRDLCHEGIVGGKRGDFEIQAERTVVEIGRADCGESPVDEHHFLMKKPAVVAQDFHAEGNRLLIIGKGGKPDHQVIRPFGDEDAHVHAADGGGLQGC